MCGGVGRDCGRWSVDEAEALVRIAVVCPYDLGRAGGVQNQVAGLTRALGSLGHAAWLVAPGVDGGNGGDDIQLVGGSRRVRVNGSVAPIALAPRSVPAALRAVRDADVVHVHEPFVPLVSLAVLAKARLPLVGTFHAAPAGWIRHTYRPGIPALKPLARRLGAAVAVSPSAAEPLGGLLGDRVPLNLIPNAVDTRLYRAGGLGERWPHRVVFVGRDDPRKGLSVLLQAWPAVRQAVPTAELVVVGASRAGVGAAALPGVIWLGWVDEARKRQELARGSVMCAPNTGQESFGVIQLEGMAAGCAMVASGLPAFRAVLGDAGVFTPVGDPRALAQALVGLLGQPARVAELAARSSRRARRFDWMVVAQQYVGLYQQLKEQRQPRARCRPGR